MGLLDGGGAEKARERAAMADVERQYPMPPKDCTSAEKMVASLQISLDTNRRTRASNGCDKGCRRVNDRYIVCFETMMGRVKQWISEQDCAKRLVDQKDAADLSLAKQELELGYQQYKAETAGSYTWAYVGVGILFAGAIGALIFKNKG